LFHFFLIQTMQRFIKKRKPAYLLFDFSGFLFPDMRFFTKHLSGQPVD